MDQMITSKQDLTWLSWSKIRHSSGTAGSFLKAYSEHDNTKIYYKLSNYNAAEGIIGHECINEIIVDRLLTLLGIEHLQYQLIHADILLDNHIIETWLCASQDFKRPGDSKIALETYYQQERFTDESPLDFCKRNGWEDYVYNMILVDYLILNRDRHGANIEVLRNRNNHTVRLAPLFDHGLSLMCRVENDKEAMEYDILSDRRVQCFIGGSSTLENLKMIPHNKQPLISKIKESDKDTILDGLDLVLPKAWLERIWEMIWMRWKYYESIRYQG